jgi:hypothetical protein
MIIVTAKYSDYDGSDYWNIGWCLTENEAREKIAMLEHEASEFLNWHTAWLEQNPEPAIEWGANVEGSTGYDQWSESYDEALTGRVALMQHQWPGRYWRLSRAPSYGMERVEALW